MLSPFDHAGPLELQTLGRFEQQIHAACSVFVFTILASGKQVIEIAFVPLTIGAGDFHTEVVTITEIDHAVQRGGVVVAVTAANLAAEFLGRLGTIKLDHAADGIAPEQRALRPAQHLHAFQVNRTGNAARHGAEKQAIHDHANGRVKVLFDFGDTDTANIGRSDATRALVGVIEQEVW